MPAEAPVMATTFPSSDMASTYPVRGNGNARPGGG
jgi:hypothetical protein